MQGSTEPRTTISGTNLHSQGALMTARCFPIVALAVVLAVTACRNDPPPPPAPVGPSAAELERARQDSIGRVRTRQDSATAARDRAARAENDRLAAAQRELRTSLEALVHFDYDEADITSDAERALREKVDILRGNPDVRMRLVGHADERGSTEYNLALGSRRAEAVKQFFTGFGLDAGRFDTTSRGEEVPLVNRSDEDAWAQNRRAEFAITAGGAELRPPR
ncbi:MAG: hypothetical protein EXR95_11105 [Gemmatimonadetes bacterium]|nr:hypothetical protein [Gemmatimonadota bacterium]